MITTFNIKYFDVMYVGVAAIYLVAAILLLKTDFIKKQIELEKIKQAQEIISKQLEENEENNKEEDKEKDNKNEKEPKEESKGEEPEGSNA